MPLPRLVILCCQVRKPSKTLLRSSKAGNEKKKKRVSRIIFKTKLAEKFLQYFLGTWLVLDTAGLKNSISNFY